MKEFGLQLWSIRDEFQDKERARAAFKTIAGYGYTQAQTAGAYDFVDPAEFRKYADEAAVAKAVSEAGFDPWEKQLAGLTEMTRRLGKKRFNELLGGLVVRPAGKPVLVPETDQRPELNNANKDFEED